jgi:hypothetical protein
MIWYWNFLTCFGCRAEISKFETTGYDFIQLGFGVMLKPQFEFDPIHVSV